MRVLPVITLALLSLILQAQSSYAQTSKGSAYEFLSQDFEFDAKSNRFTSWKGKQIFSENDVSEACYKRFEVDECDKAIAAFKRVSVQRAKEVAQMKRAHRERTCGHYDRLSIREKQVYTNNLNNQLRRILSDIPNQYAINKLLAAAALNENSEAEAQQCHSELAKIHRAIDEYDQKIKLRCDPTDIQVSASPIEDARDRLNNNYDAIQSSSRQYQTSASDFGMELYRTLELTQVGVDRCGSEKFWVQPRNENGKMVLSFGQRSRTSVITGTNYTVPVGLIEIDGDALVNVTEKRAVVVQACEIKKSNVEKEIQIFVSRSNANGKRFASLTEDARAGQVLTVRLNSDSLVISIQDEFHCEYQFNRFIKMENLERQSSTLR